VVQDNPLIVPHAEYRRLGYNESDQRVSYRELFGSHIDVTLIEKIRGATNGNFVLGNARFAQEIETVLARGTVRVKSGRPKAK
jgi:putative transposase